MAELGPGGGQVGPGGTPIGPSPVGGDHTLTIEGGALALTGQAVTLTYEGSGAHTLLLEGGAYALTGQAVSVTPGRRLPMSAHGPDRVVMSNCQNVYSAEMPLAIRAGRMAVVGAIGGVLSVIIVTMATGTGSSFAIASAGFDSDSSVAWVSDTELVVVGGVPVKAARYTASGDVVEAAQNLGDANSRAGRVIALAEGGAFAAWHQHLYESDQTFKLSWYSGSSTWTTITAVIPNEEGGGSINSCRKTVVQHPGTGHVWVFCKRDSYHSLSAIEAADGAVVNIEALLVSEQRDGKSKTPDGELPTLFPQAEGDHIVLAFQNIDTFAHDGLKCCPMTLAVFHDLTTPPPGPFNVCGTQYAQSTSMLGSALDSNGRPTLAYRRVNTDLEPANDASVWATVWDGSAWQAPTFIITPGAANKQLVARTDAPDILISDSANALRWITYGQIVYPLLGQPVDLLHGSPDHVLAIEGGAYALTGQAAPLKYGRRFAMGAADYAVTGQDVTLRHETPGAHSLMVEAGAYGVTGQTVTLEYGRRFALGATSYALTGQDVTLTRGIPGQWVLVMGAGAYALTGYAVTLGQGTLPIVIESGPMTAHLARASAVTACTALAAPVRAHTILAAQIHRET